MKRRLFALLLASTLLTSCANNGLRSDIAEFIASFSLDSCYEEYRHATYERKMTMVEGETSTITVEVFTFDNTIGEHPQYEKSKVEYVNGQKTYNYLQYLSEEDNIFYLNTIENDHEEKVAKSLEDCHEIVKNFFFTQTEIDGSVHLRGMYYGDYIKQTATAYQNYVTISDDLYVFEANYNKTISEGNYVATYQKYRVNSFGMLVDNYLTQVNDEKSIITEINVQKL